MFIAKVVGVVIDICTSMLFMIIFDYLNINTRAVNVNNISNSSFQQNKYNNACRVPDRFAESC